MRSVKPMDRTKLKQAALGQIPCDLTVKNVRLFNVFTGEVYPAEVDILDGWVVRTREEGVPALSEPKAVYDGKGLILAPGFIDTHMHVESTMMLPENLSRAIVPWGTTTVCTDPHEIGNVMGVEGVRFMLENAKKSKLRQYVLAPSCVPAVPGLETAGAEFGAKEIADLLDTEGVAGVAEIMDYVGVIHDAPRMHAIIEEGDRRGAYLQGHSPYVTGADLAAYRLGGPMSDHESATAAEVREKLRAGMHVNLRASSLADDLGFLVDGCKDHPWRDHVSFCTDDVHAEDLLTLGHINNVIRKAVKAGLDGKECYKMASFNAAREYGFKELGAIAPGYVADFQLIKDFDGSRPAAVFIEGALVAEEGRYLGGDAMEAEYVLPNTVNIPQLKSEEDFVLRVPEGHFGNTITVNVLCPINGTRLLRKPVPTELPVKNGAVDISSDPSLIFVINANRYGTGTKTIAVYRDFGLKEGALASTIAHDSHNMNICYHTPEEALAAAKTLKACGGGICIVKNGVETHVALPAAGLMSQKPCEEIANDIRAIQKVLEPIAEPGVHVLSTVVMSLPVLPGVVIGDLGLIDGTTQTLVPVFA